MSEGKDEDSLPLSPNLSLSPGLSLTSLILSGSHSLSYLAEMVAFLCKLYWVWLQRDMSAWRSGAICTRMSSIPSPFQFIRTQLGFRSQLRKRWWDAKGIVDGEGCLYMYTKLASWFEAILAAIRQCVHGSHGPYAQVLLFLRGVYFLLGLLLGILGVGKVLSEPVESLEESHSCGCHCALNVPLHSLQIFKGKLFLELMIQKSSRSSRQEASEEPKVAMAKIGVIQQKGASNSQSLRTNWASSAQRSRMAIIREETEQTNLVGRDGTRNVLLVGVHKKGDAGRIHLF